MTHKDLTIADVLRDPLIRQMMCADRISLSGMTSLLQDAARLQKSGKQARRIPEAALRLHGIV
ncbi:hypothetical protein [Rhizobium herbae]|uniref:Uncharacterized protein n=1 Tax=Rhizobium herbae TaxID=508661 RepID=A0ABS4ER77_9HYPH|nr:hypothetical protein [Rhizobium herbae]MBP1860452.1 hypothetical protein [Rhizobium herbae]